MEDASLESDDAAETITTTQPTSISVVRDVFAVSLSGTPEPFCASSFENGYELTIEETTFWGCYTL